MTALTKHRARVAYLIKRLKQSPTSYRAAECQRYLERLRRRRAHASLPYTQRADMRRALDQAIFEYEQSRRPKLAGGAGFNGIKLSRRSQADLKLVI